MPKSGYLCNHALCNRARPATITVEEARDLWGAIARMTGSLARASAPRLLNRGVLMTTRPRTFTFSRRKKFVLLCLDQNHDGNVKSRPLTRPSRRHNFE
jgi:hypothetical protein